MSEEAVLCHRGLRAGPWLLALAPLLLNACAQPFELGLGAPTGREAQGAFPDWIGVYGVFQRHDGGNPGRFTVLMNVDRWGLRASLELRQGDGPWRTLELSYAGNSDGNSIWTGVPARPFEPGAQVEFAFRGYDESGREIHDSDGGRNYRFDVPALGWSSPRLVWPGAERALGVVELDPGLALFSADAYRYSRDGEQFGEPVSCQVEGYTLERVVGEPRAVHLLYRDPQGGYASRTAQLDDGPEPLRLGPLAPLPVAAEAEGLQLAADAGDLFALWVRPAEPLSGGASALLFARKPAAVAAWSEPLWLAPAARYPALAAAASGVHAVYQGPETNRASYLRSDDRGASFSALPGFEAGLGWEPGRYVRLYADAWQLHVLFNDYTPPDASRLRYLRRHRNASVWEEPSAVLEQRSYKSTAELDAFVAGERGVMLAGHAQSWYGPAGAPFHAVSGDGGHSFALVSPYDDPQSWNTAAPLWQRVSLHSSLSRGSALTMAGGSEAGLMLARLLVAPQQAPPPLQWLGNISHWPRAGAIDHDDDLWIDAELWPQRSAQAVELRYSVDGGVEQSLPMLFHRQLGDNDGYHVCLPRLGAGAELRFEVRALGADGQLLVDDNGGAGYRAVVNGGGALVWLGDTSHWPPAGDIDPEDELWVDTQTYPRSTAREVLIQFRVGEGLWLTRPMSFAGEAGNNDSWHVNLGRFPGGARVQFRVQAQDGLGALLLSDRDGQPFVAQINAGSP